MNCELLLRGVVRLRRPSLNHDAGVATLVVLTLVGDGADDVTGVEADGSAKGCECGDKHRHDDTDKFNICFHSCGSFFVFECTRCPLVGETGTREGVI